MMNILKSGVNGSLNIAPILAIGILAVSFSIAAVSPARVLAQTDKTRPDEEKSSLTMEAVGRAGFGEDTTMRQARAQALLIAKRMAAKSALTRVRSFTRMKNFLVTDDIVESFADANVIILKMDDRGIVKNQYEIWIKAEVTYSKLIDTKWAEKAVAPAPSKVNAPKVVSGNEPLKVRVWTPRKYYKNKERMVIYLRGNKDFYGTIYYENAKNLRIQLLPNEYRSNNMFRAGVTYRIPGKGDKFTLDVGKPFGIERITVFASSKPTGRVNGESIGAGLQTTTKSRKQLAKSLRGVNIQATPDAVPGGAGGIIGDIADFYEATWIVTTAR